MTYQPPDFNLYWTTLANAFPIGRKFFVQDAATVLHNRCGVKDPSTANVYASQTLRRILEIQDSSPCPEGVKLVRPGKRGYHWEEPPCGT